MFQILKQKNPQTNLPIMLYTVFSFPEEVSPAVTQGVFKNFPKATITTLLDVLVLYLPIKTSYQQSL